MNPIADDLLVALLLALSLGYAAMKLAPRAVLRKFQAAAAHGLAAAPAMFRLGGIVQRLAATSLQQTKGTCGGCNNCAAPPSLAEPGEVTEVMVPLARIGRRGED